MKQAESRTRKKSKQVYKRLGLTHGQVEQAADLTTQYLKLWTERELKRLTIDEKLPVCLPNGAHGFLIGKYHMRSVSPNCWRVLDHNEEHVHDFARKLSAVFYCLATQANKISLADRILNADTQVGRLESEQDFYMYTKQQSLKKKDYFRLDLANSRFQNTRMQLSVAIEELEKTINTAKYLQV
jgi:hypothetical protein